jgi:hypothetical protein
MRPAPYLAHERLPDPREARASGGPARTSAYRDRSRVLAPASGHRMLVVDEYVESMTLRPDRRRHAGQAGPDDQKIETPSTVARHSKDAPIIQ